MKIVMKKNLPDSSGKYFWSKSPDWMPIIVEVYQGANEPMARWCVEAHYIGPEIRNLSVESMGGYWAKLTKDDFEFKG